MSSYTEISSPPSQALLPVVVPVNKVSTDSVSSEGVTNAANPSSSSSSSASRFSAGSVLRRVRSSKYGLFGVVAVAVLLGTVLVGGYLYPEKANALYSRVLFHREHPLQMISHRFVPLMLCEKTRSVCSDYTPVGPGQMFSKSYKCEEGLKASKCQCGGVKVDGNPYIPVVTHNALSGNVCSCLFTSTSVAGASGWFMTLGCM